MIISLIGFAGRMAGDLLTSALGWASSLLFGRVPRSHQVFLVLMMALSLLWMVAILGVVLPSINSLLLAGTPHPPFVNRAWLGVALIVLAAFLPLGVGLAGYLVPASGEREEGAGVAREVLRGYLLAPVISGLLVFLAGVGIVRKVRSARHGWADVHVPIVVKPDGYDEVVRDLHDALVGAGLEVTAEDAPRVLTVPAEVLTRVAGPNVRKLRPDHLVDLDAKDLRVGVYPSDIAISGGPSERTRARAAILSRLATSAAHLTTSAEAQKVEDRLERLAASRTLLGGRLDPMQRTTLAEIDATLLTLEIPTDEWDILYRLRLQIERDLLVGAEPGTVFPGDGKTAVNAGLAVAAAERSGRDAAPPRGPSPVRSRRPVRATATAVRPTVRSALAKKIGWSM